MLRIDLNGKVTMIGTSALPIVIRGVTATGGVWNRMTVGAMGDVALDNVVLSDAGADYFFLRTVLAISGKASIENVTITRSGGSCVVLAEMSVVTPRDLADGSNGNSFTGCGPMPITNLRP